MATNDDDNTMNKNGSQTLPNINVTTIIILVNLIRSVNNINRINYASVHVNT